MNNSLLPDLYLKHYLAVWHNLLLSQVETDCEQIHRFRLSVKKLKAYNLLAARLSEPEQSAQFIISKKIRRYYKLAGQLRDCQVQQAALAGYEAELGRSFADYSSWLRRNELKTVEKYHRKRRKMIRHAAAAGAKKFNFEFGQGESRDSEKETVASAVRNLADNVMALANSVTDEPGMHLLRIRTKRLRYLMNIAGQLEPDSAGLHVTTKKLHEAELVIGRWHDCQVGAEKLNEFLRKQHDDRQHLQDGYPELLARMMADRTIAYNEALEKIQMLLREA